MNDHLGWVVFDRYHADVATFEWQQAALLEGEQALQEARAIALHHEALFFQAKVRERGGEGEGGWDLRVVMAVLSWLMAWAVSCSRSGRRWSMR